MIVIAADQTHQFLNDGGCDVLFVCLIPPPAAYDHAGRPTGVEQTRTMS